MVYWGGSISHELGKLRQEGITITNNMCIDEQVTAMEKQGSVLLGTPFEKANMTCLLSVPSEHREDGHLYPVLSPTGTNSPTFPS